MDKHILNSRTVRFNMAMAALTVLLSNVELLRPYLNEGGYLLLLMLSSAGGVYLRSITREPVRFK